ncbi:MAG: AMP-dependent synthetase/ligase [Bifidobacteriaceae bacterium]|jgi:long-chain acyl-CoA synthetase|nr:AMP-dependent synthetase/ligase [Bifidobacteriaceae bacterium]
MVSTTPVAHAPSPDESIAALLFERRDRDPDATIIETRGPSGWQPITAAAFCQSVEALAKGFIAAGIKHGACVGIMGRTSERWTRVDYALWMIGAAGVPIYETSSASQAAWIVQDSGMTGAVTETAANAALLRSSLQGQLWVMAEGGLESLVVLGREVPDAVLQARFAAVSGVDLATVIYTSGTTGRPKGAELTHLNFTTAARNIAIALDYVCGPGSRGLLFLPLAHVFARVINVIAMYSPTVMAYSPDTKELMSDLATFRPTFMLVVPRVLEKVYNAAEASTGGGFKLKLFRWAAKVAIVSSREIDSRGGHTAPRRLQHTIASALVYRKLRHKMGGRMIHAICGGAPLGERLGHFFRGIGLTIYEGYGLTETTAPTAVNRQHINKIGTVGPPLPGQTVAISPDGEVLVKGFHVFRAYRNNPGATAAAFSDGWFHTGDIGQLDQDGCLAITGRRKELIVTASGKNVAPAVLEDRLRGHPLVSQVVVVGEQRPFVGALVTLDEEMIPGWLANHGKGPLTAEQARIDPDIRASLTRAVARTNEAVSRAESIREFRILATDFTEENGYLTPSLKVRREQVLQDFAAEVEALYQEAAYRQAARRATRPPKASAD